MANLNVSNRNNLYLSLNKDEYWDFYVNKDASICNGGAISYDGTLYDKCLLSYINLADKDCIGENDWILSNPQYQWDDAVSIGYKLYDIKYTGIDNGLYTYRKDRITNKDFVTFFDPVKGFPPLALGNGDMRLKLHAISGNTLVYEYPLEHIDGCCTKLNGGFYQGFFKTECDKYQVLPSYFEDGDVYNFEFTLKRSDLDPQSDKTLNDKHPDNKGIFFFIGTRAENKWIYLYDKDDVDGLEQCFQLGMDDFVEGGEIDKKDYIIGNFYDPNPDFEGYDPFELGDYTNYNYYDEELYASDPCDWEDMSYYLDVDYNEKPKLIDEDNPHTTLDWCCGEDEPDNFVLRPFFNGCGCPIRYKRVKATEGKETASTATQCTAFGDNYIGDFDGVMDLDEARDYIEAELDITDIEYYTENGFNLADANQYYFYTDNKFLMFDRTKDGYKVNNWVEGTEMMYWGRKSQFKGNLFIYMNRTKTGYTVADIDELREANDNDYDPYKDLYNNALAFRVTDKGEIGYRLLTVNCEKEERDKTEMMEGYSFEGVIPMDEWFVVNVRINFLGGDKMKLMFYVNGKLVYITKELPRLELRALDDIYEKQEGVPFNISLGGGTQGLADTVQYNYMLEPTRVYPMEKYFAGSFIGYLKSFKIYNCRMEQMILANNAKYELGQTSSE